MEEKTEVAQLNIHNVYTDQFDEEETSDGESDIDIRIEASISEAGAIGNESLVSLNINIEEKSKQGLSGKKKHKCCKCCCNDKQEDSFQKDGKGNMVGSFKLNGTNQDIHDYSKREFQFQDDDGTHMNELAERRKILGCRSLKELGSTQLYLKVDAIAEDEEIKAGFPNYKGLYRDRNLRPDNYIRDRTTGGEDEDLSHKITEEARVLIQDLHEKMKLLFETMTDALGLILEKDFRVCIVALEIISQLQRLIENLIGKLRYSPYEHELVDINIRMQAMIEELELESPFVLLRLVEFGYYMYELSKLLREEFIPTSFALLIHSIQSRLYRMNTGRVIRQIYYVPSDMDPIVGTYFKSRRMLRIENFCRCKIVLLSPDDPRTRSCPMNFRTIEVNFDPQHGRYLGFAQLLNRCSPSKIYTVKLAATIFKRYSGVETHLWPEEMVELARNEGRSMFTALQSDMVAGTGQAIAPKIEPV